MNGRMDERTVGSACKIEGTFVVFHLVPHCILALRNVCHMVLLGLMNSL
jgi:hypothetical protein